MSVTQCEPCYWFDLAPGQKYSLFGRLLWVAYADAFPRLLFPLSRDSLNNSAVRGDALRANPEEAAYRPRFLRA